MEGSSKLSSPFEVLPGGAGFFGSLRMFGAFSKAPLPTAESYRLDPDFGAWSVHIPQLGVALEEHSMHGPCNTLTPIVDRMREYPVVHQTVPFLPELLLTRTFVG